MKIRNDFVTNSSSTSFGAASATGIITAILSALGIGASMAAEEAASELGSGGDAPGNNLGPDRDFDPDSFSRSDVDYNKKMEKFEKEIEEYEKEWEETKGTLEGEDYKKAQKQ